jgi:hypothetical protein
MVYPSNHVWEGASQSAMPPVARRVCLSAVAVDETFGEARR